jgi:hypothetical protein
MYPDGAAHLSAMSRLQPRPTVRAIRPLVSGLRMLGHDAGVSELVIDIILAMTLAASAAGGSHRRTSFGARS